MSDTEILAYTDSKITELEKEKCELLGIIQGKDKVIAELKVQNEKMKCCENCKNRKGWKGEKPCLDCKFNQFGEGTEDKWEVAE